MQTDANKLPPKQVRAIEALLVDPGLHAAAKIAGINVTTLWRWLQQPAFAEAYRDAQHRLLDETITALRSASRRAVALLLEVVDNAAASDQTRVTAASRILELTFRARELELEDRIRALEQAAENHHVFRSTRYQA